MTEKIKKEWMEGTGGVRIILLKKKKEEKKEEEDYPVGRCYLLGKCAWWNPPMHMRNLNYPCFCIRCWRFKK